MINVKQSRQDSTRSSCCSQLHVSKTVYLGVPNPEINPGIQGLAFLNHEIPRLENGPGIAIHTAIVLLSKETKNYRPIAFFWAVGVV